MRLFVFNCLLLASVAIALPNRNHKRDLSYFKNLIKSAIFGRSQIRSQPTPVLQEENAYKIIRLPEYDDVMIKVAPKKPVVKKFVYRPAVEKVNLNAFGTVVGTKSKDDTLVAVKEVDNLISTGILYGGYNNVMKESVVQMFPSLNTANYVVGKNIKTARPVIETRPVLTEVVETRPVLTEVVETRTRPFLTEVVETRPVLTAANETRPFLTEVVETKPGLTEVVVTRPVLTEVVETRTVLTEVVETRPDLTEANETRPFLTEVVETRPGLTEVVETRPVLTEANETRPFLTEVVETSPGLTEVVETRPVLTDVVEARSDFTEVVETRPVLTEANETRPFLKEVDETGPGGLTEVVETRPVHTNVVETRPVLTDVVETRPVLLEIIETRPVLTEVVETRTVLTEVVETRPVLTEANETRPFLTEVVETSPGLTEVGENRPVLTEANETRPFLTEVDETTSGLTEVVETRPVLTNAVETRPVLTEVVETRPVLTEANETRPFLTEVDETTSGLTEVVETRPVLTNAVETRPVLTEVVETRPFLRAEMPFVPIYPYKQIQKNEPVMTYTAHNNPGEIAPVQEVFQYQSPTVYELSYPRVETNSYEQKSFREEVLTEGFGTVADFAIPAQRLRPLKYSPVRYNLRPTKNKTINPRPLPLHSQKSLHFEKDFSESNDKVNSPTRKVEAFNNLGEVVDLSQTLGPIPPQYLTHVDKKGGNSAVTKGNTKQIKTVPIVGSKDNVYNTKIYINVYRLQSNPNTVKVIKGCDVLTTIVKYQYVNATAVNKVNTTKVIAPVKDKVNPPVEEAHKQSLSEYIETYVLHTPRGAKRKKTFRQKSANDTSLNVTSNKQAASVSVKENNNRGRGDIPDQ